MVTDLPSASFGKPGGSGAYQIITQHEAFGSPEVARAFQKICSCFEWRSTTSGSAHPPCFAVLPTAHAVLVAKYSDTGRDAAGRPHTLRVDCLLASTENFADAWRQLAGSDPPVRTGSLQITGDPATHWTINPGPG